MSAPVLYAGLGWAGNGTQSTGMPRVAQGALPLPDMAKVERPYVAHLYDRDMRFKRVLGGGTIKDTVLNKPGLKATQNGGLQPIVLQLAASQPGGNLLVDGGFELSDTLVDVQTSWALGTPGEWALMSTAGDIRRGARALKCTRTGLSGWNYCSTIGRIPVTPGQTYSASWWVKQNAGTRQTHVKVDWYDASGSAIAGGFFMNGTDGALPWTYYTASVIAPPYAVTALFYLMTGYWDGATGTNAQVWWDDAKLVTGTELGDSVALTDVIRLMETGDNTGNILLSGNVDTTPEFAEPGGPRHEINVTPWMAELAGADFNKNYAVPTDPAQFVRDAAALTLHCSTTPISCPDTGLKFAYDFQQSNGLDAVHVAKQMAGANYWYYVDDEGVVWFQPINLAGKPTITLKKGVDYSIKRPIASVDGMKNVIPAMGGSNPGDPGRISSKYDNPTSRKLYGRRVFTPTLSYPTVTDQATLDAIVASLGAQYDVVQRSVEVYLPALGKRLHPGRDGGLTVRFWEPSVEQFQESDEPGIGAYSPNYMLWDAEAVGAGQLIKVGTVPYADLDTTYEADRIAQRVSVVAATAVPIAPVAPPDPITSPPPPPPQAQINVQYNFNCAAGVYGAGLTSIGSVGFTTPRAGVCQFLGQVDARMEVWDNYVGAPRRDVWGQINGIVANPHQELPFGIQRGVYASNSAAGIALPAGTYTAVWFVQVAGSNRLHIYSGWGQVAWTG